MVLITFGISFLAWLYVAVESPIRRKAFYYTLRLFSLVISFASLLIGLFAVNAILVAAVGAFLAGAGLVTATAIKSS